MITTDIDKLSSEDYFRFLTYKSSVFEDTMAFQQKYGLWDSEQSGFLPDENMKVKLGHLQEELNEIVAGYVNKDLAQVCDGLIDLIYVASGTLNLMNMPAQQLWNDVQLRNMKKIRATADNMGKRGSTFDVIKPEGWTGPRTEDIIEASKN
jgi:predicted HAD superfamily Cof-like phosphohydrolase